VAEPSPWPLGWFGHPPKSKMAGVVERLETTSKSLWSASTTPVWFGRTLTRGFFFFFFFFLLWPFLGGGNPTHAKREWFQSTPIYSLGIAEPPHRPWGWFCQLSIFLFLKCFFFFSFFIIIFNYAYRHV